MARRKKVRAGFQSALGALLAMGEGVGSTRNLSSGSRKVLQAFAGPGRANAIMSAPVPGGRQLTSSERANRERLASMAASDARSRAALAEATGGRSYRRMPTVAEALQRPAKGKSVYAKSNVKVAVRRQKMPAKKSKAKAKQSNSDC